MNDPAPHLSKEALNKSRVAVTVGFNGMDAHLPKRHRSAKV